MKTPRKSNKQPKANEGKDFVEIPVHNLGDPAPALPGGMPVPEGFELLDMDDPRAVAARRARQERETAAGLREQAKPPGGDGLKTYPAITVPVRITAEEHEEIAAFCEDNRISVVEFVTLRGVGFEMKDFTGDAANRAGLMEQIVERFGPQPKTGQSLEVSIFNEENGSLFAKFELDAGAADELREQAREQGVDTRALLWRYIEEGVAERTRAATKPVTPTATRTVNVELSAFGSCLLQMVMIHDGHATEADAFRAMLASTGGSLGEAIGHYGDEGSLEDRLAPQQEEDGDALTAAADRDDLPLAAAGKPPANR